MKKLILTGIIAILLMLGVNFAASPNFSLSPISGQVLKLHCNYNFDILLDSSGQNYNAFASTVKFNALETSGIHKTINSPFTDNAVGFVTGGDLYRAYGALPAGQKSSALVSAATFGFRTIANITGTLLQFTTYTGGSITFGPATTADGTTINGYDVASADILGEVYDASYSFIPYPCVIDTDAPLFTSVSPGNGAYQVASGQLFSALVYDRIGTQSVVGPLPLATNSTRHYRYSGLDVSDLNNYQYAPSGVDNQAGVNSGSLRVTVSCSSCASFGGPYLLSGSALNIVLRTGDALRNRYTWDSKDRGYRFSFIPPAPYEIEKQVFVTGIVMDNPNETGQIHTGYLNLSFNAPRSPTITPIYPLSGAIFVDWRNTLMVQLYFADDWAGIDTGTISITIPAIMSGIDILMTGYTYSGSDLQIMLSGGSEGTGNAGSYLVQFYPKWNFASNTGIRITGFVVDLAGNTGVLDMSFVTRPDCAFWGCNPIFQAITMGGINMGTGSFSGSLIIITGFDLNSPYPYLTGELGDTLLCGFPYSGTILTGNIPITDTNDVSVKGSLYTGTKLYVTGLNFIIENGVIVISP